MDYSGKSEGLDRRAQIQTIPRASLFLRFLVAATCSPAMQVLFYEVVHHDGSSLPKYLFGFKAIESGGSNVEVLVLMPFMIFTITAYFLFLATNFMFLRMSRNQLGLSKFLATRLSWLSLLPCIVGASLLYVWAGQGMEGNVFGFLFALPLLAGCAFELISFVRQNLLLTKQS